MAVKLTTASSSAAGRIVKKYRHAKPRSVSSNNNNHSGGDWVKTESYWRLKRVVPNIQKKENISQLDVILEAISYIQTLQGNLEEAANRAVVAGGRQQ